jgi:Tfp pilus assembly protein PilF
VPVFGCLLRLVLVIGVVLLLAIAAVWMLAGGAVSSWFVDVGQSTGVMGGVPAQTERGIVAYRRGDVALAERELEQSARSYRRSALALLYLARIRDDAGDQVGAGQYLEEAVAREPDNALARRMMGEYQLTQARRVLSGPTNAVDAPPALMAAEENLERAVELAPSDRRARGYLACSLDMLGRADEARAALGLAGSGPWNECVRVTAP